MDKPAPPDPALRFWLAQVAPLTGLLLYFAVYAPFAVAFAALLPFAELDRDWGHWLVPFLASWTACFLALGFAMHGQALLGFAQPRLQGRVLLAALLLSGGLFAGSTLLMQRQGLYNDPAWVLLNSLALLGSTSAIGYAVAREIQRSGHLIAVAVVGLVVDLWSVARGPSQKIAESVINAAEQGVYRDEVAAPLVSFLLLRFPVPGDTAIQAMLGAGDLVFLGFFFGCVVRFGFAPLVNYLGLTLGLVGSLLLVNWLHMEFGIPAIPALPILAPLFVLLNFRKMRMSPGEWRITLVFVILLVVIGLVLAGLETLKFMQTNPAGV